MRPGNNEPGTEGELTYPAPGSVKGRFLAHLAPTSDGRTARIAQYALPLDAIAAAGEPGRQYVAEAMAASRR